MEKVSLSTAFVLIHVFEASQLPSCCDKLGFPKPVQGKAELAQAAPSGCQK